MNGYKAICILLISQHIFLICHGNQMNLDSLEDIVFKLVDLTVSYRTSKGHVTIEAFKSSQNDEIITKKEQARYNQLTWLSLGNPRLVKLFRKENSTYETLSLNDEGFSIYVETLNDDHITLFQKHVKERYDIDVKPSQIVRLALSKFECKLSMTFEKKKYEISGAAFQLNVSPLEVVFYAPVDSLERDILERKIAKYGKNLDLQFRCDALRTQGKAFKTNKLTITSDQIQELSLIDEIFGPVDEVFITRNQLSDLASKIYSELNIHEEYEIDQKEFDSKFINDFILQNAGSMNRVVDIDKALKHMSRFNFEKNLKPDVVKKELEKVYKIEAKGNKKNIVVNNEWKEERSNEGRFSIRFGGVKFIAN